MLTLPSEAPLNPGAVTVKLKRGSESMSEVWEERVLNTKMGKPLSFLAALVGCRTWTLIVVEI